MTLKRSRPAPLAAFREGCARAIEGYLEKGGMESAEATRKADERLPAMIEGGDLDLSAVRLSDYFFA